MQQRLIFPNLIRNKQQFNVVSIDIIHMKNDLKKLESNFYNELQLLLKTPNNMRSAFELCKRYFTELKSKIIEKNFKNLQDEIDCFKTIKPKLHAELIYFKEMFGIQQNLPLGSDQIKINYLNNYFTHFNLFFEENKTFIQYVRSGSIDLDNQFFIRRNRLSYQNYTIDFIGVDFRWNTGYDIILAKYLAFEKLEQEIKYKLSLIHQTNEKDFHSGLPQINLKKQLHWTESKTSLVELIYALHSVGTFNNGQTDLKTITEVIQTTFHIELGDYYGIYHELKSRKIDRTKFLNNLIKALNHRMEADEA